MIVKCPSCSTHYRHPDGVAARQARCSRCRAVFFPTPVQRQYVVVRTAGVEAGAPVAPPETFEMAPALNVSLAAHDATASDAAAVPVTASPVAPAAAMANVATGADAESAGAVTPPFPTMTDDVPPVAAEIDAAGWDERLPDMDGPADDPAPAHSGVVERAAESLRDLGLPPGLIGDEPAPPREAPAPVAHPTPADDVVRAEEPSGRRPLLELLVALLLGGAGAAGLWYSTPTLRSLDVGDPAWNAWLHRPEPLHWAAIGGALGLLVAWVVVRWMAGRR